MAAQLKMHQITEQSIHLIIVFRNNYTTETYFAVNFKDFA